MALAPYFGKAALAAADILHGVSPVQFEELLAPIVVGIAIDEEVLHNFECQTLSELLTNLLARLYPSLVLVGPDSWVDSMEQLVLSINPNLDLRREGTCAAWVCVGNKRVDADALVVIHASSEGWIARISEIPIACGKSINPLGAAAAACLAAANVFRTVFSQYLAAAERDKNLSVKLEEVQPFLGKSLRELYQKGICGGTLLSTNPAANIATIVVPMAFQSAMAGVMLASEMILYSMGASSAPPRVTTKINLLRPIGRYLSEPESKHSKCICQDPDFVDAYIKKFGQK